jgi:hypothetical protein
MMQQATQGRLIVSALSTAVQQWHIRHSALGKFLSLDDQQLETAST